MSVRVFAPAKINLTLEVGRPRADGLHPIQSVVVFADVGDWIGARGGGDGSLHIYGRFGPALMKETGANIIFRASEIFARETGFEGADIDLDKNLPLASGIGGGSSDAAATLKALNAVANAGLDEARLCKLARELGADVPACVVSRPLYMTGVGAEWTPMTIPAFGAVLVNPGKPLATADIYRQFDAMGLGGGFEQKPAPTWRDRQEALGAIGAVGNDLETAARVLLPEINDVFSTLRADKRAAYVSMSGSGATVFAITEDKAAARALAHDLGRRRPDWWVVDTLLGGA